MAGEKERVLDLLEDFERAATRHARTTCDFMKLQAEFLRHPRMKQLANQCYERLLEMGVALEDLREMDDAYGETPRGPY